MVSVDVISGWRAWSTTREGRSRATTVYSNVSTRPATCTPRRYTDPSSAGPGCSASASITEGSHSKALEKVAR